MENRYDDILREGNQLIIDLTPANHTLRIETALEIKQMVGNSADTKILEIGSGEGDLTKHILGRNEAMHIDCLDISKEMIDASKPLLTKFLDRINFIPQDALEYLSSTDFTYDIIVTAWTVHNFKQADKTKLFEEIYKNLSAGGSFILMDKVYIGNEEEKRVALHTQLKRYTYTEKNLKAEITSHEQQDFTDDYRMDESTTIEGLKNIGFKHIRIADRVERDIILIAEK